MPYPRYGIELCWIDGNHDDHGQNRRWSKIAAADPSGAVHWAEVDVEGLGADVSDPQSQAWAVLHLPSLEVTPPAMRHDGTDRPRPNPGLITGESSAARTNELLDGFGER